MEFTYNQHTQTGRVTGEGWNTTYSGFETALDCWMFVQSDGFSIAPGGTLEADAIWRAPLVR